MELVVGDILTKVKTKDPSKLAIIREICRARPDGYQFMPRYRMRQWDGYISLMRGFTIFPTGLLDLVCEELENHNIACKIVWPNDTVEPVNIVKADSLLGIELRDYQMEAVTTLLVAGRGVAKMATNAGKTAVMAAVLYAFGKDVKSVTIVHRKELLHQTAERFGSRLVGHRVGIIGDGIWKPAIANVTMIQTLANHQEKVRNLFHDNVIVMVDECHHASSNQMMDILFQIPGQYRIGFSGTPLKYDILADMKLIGATGPVVIDVTNTDLIEEGYSAKPVVYVHTIESDSWDVDFHTAYDDEVVNNAQRNDIITDEAVEAGVERLVLVLVNRIEHGTILNNMIPDSIFVNGSQSTEFRQEVLASMRFPNATGVVIASPIFDEGVDIPGVDVVILAGGGKSHVKLLQRIGRGLRAKEGRNIVEVHDFIDDTNEYLLNHSENRISIYEQEGFKMALK